MRLTRLSILCAALLAVLALPSAAPAAARGKLYVIGLGPAGPQTATLQALETIGRMDALVTAERHRKPFAKYLAGKPVLFDQIAGLWDYKGKFFTRLSPAERREFEKERERLTGERLAAIDALLAQGKNLGMLDGGNPMVFGPCHWYTERMDPGDVVFIAGMGSDAAAMAALGKSVIPAHRARFMLQSAPFVITDDNPGEAAAVFQDLAKYQLTMIFYMALKNPEPFFAAMGRAMGADTPCAVVFYAGDPDRERVVKGTLADMPGKLSDEKERYLGLLLVGRFLEGRPYLAGEK